MTVGVRIAENTGASQWRASWRVVYRPSRYERQIRQRIRNPVVVLRLLLSQDDQSSGLNNSRGSRGSFKGSARCLKRTLESLERPLSGAGVVYLHFLTARPQMRACIRLRRGGWGRRLESNVLVEEGNSSTSCILEPAPTTRIAGLAWMRIRMQCASRN